MIRKNYQTDLCVVGGGLSGLCTAIAAARHGIKVVLIQDRAVLGGNASSEINVDNSHQRFVTHNVNWKIKTLELIPKETHGAKEFRVFRFEFE